MKGMRVAWFGAREGAGYGFWVAGYGLLHAKLGTVSHSQTSPVLLYAAVSDRQRICCEEWG